MARFDNLSELWYDVREKSAAICEREGTNGEGKKTKTKLG